MTKTQKLIASLTAVGALCVGSLALAAPQDHGAPPAPDNGVPLCPLAQKVPGGKPMGYEAMGRVLTLTDEQKPLWQSYIDARSALRTDPGPKYDKPAADMQERLERHAAGAEARAAQLRKMADARAALLKSLSVEQKYVLETYEFNRRCMKNMRTPPMPPQMRDFHRFRGHPGFGPGCGMNSMPMPDCPMAR